VQGIIAIVMVAIAAAITVAVIIIIVAIAECLKGFGKSLVSFLSTY
jgi:hypothetical protein